MLSYCFCESEIQEPLPWVLLFRISHKGAIKMFGGASKFNLGRIFLKTHSWGCLQASEDCLSSSLAIGHILAICASICCYSQHGSFLYPEFLLYLNFGSNIPSLELPFPLVLFVCFFVLLESELLGPAPKTKGRELLKGKSEYWKWESIRSHFRGFLSLWISE